MPSNTSIEKLEHQVCFEKPVTADEAKTLFLAEEYADITDFESVRVYEVVSVESS